MAFIEYLRMLKTPWGIATCIAIVIGLNIPNPLENNANEKKKESEKYNKMVDKYYENLEKMKKNEELDSN